MRSPLFIPVAIGLAWIVGCTPPPPNAPPDSLVEVPSEFLEASVQPAGSFCPDLESTELDALVARALDDNLSIQAAWLRVTSAELNTELAGTALLPTVSAEFSGRRTHQANAGSPFGPTTFTVWSASVPVSYELDLWGRIAAAMDQANAQIEAARFDADAMGVSIAAQVTETYLDVVHQHALISLIDAQIAHSEQVLATVQGRMRFGQAVGADILAQEAQIASLVSQRTSALATAERAEVRLATLLGTSDVPSIQAEALPEVDLAEAGVSADRLTGRPDVQAAYYRWLAADREHAVALANRLPALRLTASLSAQSQNLTELLDQIFWSIAGTVSQTLFDNGQRNIAVELAELGVDQAAIAYADALLTAIGEVQDALVAQHHQRTYLADLANEAALTQASFDTASARYAQGAGDYLGVQSAQAALYQVAQRQLAAQRQALSHQVQLCRALGNPDAVARVENP